jgi:hypothetical protein
MLAAAVAIVGYAGVMQSLAGVRVRSDAGVAHHLAPGDGRITAAYAKSLSGLKASAADRTQADMLAREALEQDPTAVSAASTLGLNAQVRGAVGDARRAFAYAETLSRRDIQTQLWAIEDAVSREDIAAAVGHYDVALRVSVPLAQLLFPVLAAAASDLSIQPVLVKTLSTRPRWGENFINYIAASGVDPLASSAFLRSLRRAHVPVPESARGSLVNALIKAGHADAAWSYYASVRRDVDRRESRDPGFVANNATPSVLDWMPIDSESASTSIVRNDKAGMFDFAVPSGSAGPLLQQKQVLPPGSYTVRGTVIGIDPAERALPYWELSCEDGRKLGRVAVPGSGDRPAVFVGTFNVPESCPIQTLAFSARLSESVAGVTGQITRIQLKPTR